MPLIEWMTVRLDVSEDEWRRNKDMEPQRRGSVPPLHTRKGNTTLGLSKTTLGGGVHVQPVGLNAETKKDRHRADGERCLLTFPFIGHVRFARSPGVGVNSGRASIFLHRDGKILYMRRLFWEFQSPKHAG